jgi:hypothetical protein
VAFFLLIKGTKTRNSNYNNMIVLTPSVTAQTFSFIPRDTTYNVMQITDDQTNVTQTITITSSTTGDYVNTITATFALVDGHFYNLVLKNGSTIIYKDRIFCTSQNIATFSVNNGEYVSNVTTNDFIVYE